MNFLIVALFALAAPFVVASSPSEPVVIGEPTYRMTITITINNATLQECARYEAVANQVFKYSACSVETNIEKSAKPTEISDWPEVKP